MNNKEMLDDMLRNMGNLRNGIKLEIAKNLPKEAYLNMLNKMGEIYIVEVNSHNESEIKQELGILEETYNLVVSKLNEMNVKLPYTKNIKEYKNELKTNSN